MKKIYQKLKAKQMDKKIEIGTVVKLKSGGFDMTVQDIAITDKWDEDHYLFRKGDFLCRWVTKDDHCEERWFSKNTLIPK